MMMYYTPWCPHGWIPGLIQTFNEDDHTYDVLVKWKERWNGFESILEDGEIEETVKAEVGQIRARTELKEIECKEIQNPSIK